MTLWPKGGNEEMSAFFMQLNTYILGLGHNSSIYEADNEAFNSSQSDIQLHHRIVDVRSNSYLPYSHRRDPGFNPARSHEPLYIEEDMSSISNPDKDGRSATLLQEELPLDAFDSYSEMQSPRSKTAVVFPTSAELPPRVKKRKLPKSCCGISFFICIPFWTVFIIAAALIWYFCWPRTPTLSFGDASVKDGPVWGPDTNPALQSDWYVNITIDNSANWVPTRINNIAFNVLDTNTQQFVGHGNTNSFTLPGRSIQTLNVTVSINYTASSTTDQTFTDLYSACGPQKVGDSPPLSIDFQAVFDIWGIVWHPVAIVSPGPDGFNCPLS
ncbi:unnamed protein product [Umbelopsis ramanniana]